MLLPNDTTIGKLDDTHEEFDQTLEEAYLKILDWFNVNQLSLDMSKSDV